MKFLNVLAAALLMLSGIAMAQAQAGPASAPMAAGALTDAVVQRIDRPSGEVVLKHGDIPNLAMPPMTMAFTADKSTMDKLKVGDKVRFHSEIKGGKPTLTHVEAAR